MPGNQTKYELRVGDRIHTYYTPARAYWALLKQRNHPEGPPKLTKIFGEF
jgi:hypothetical protein